MENSNFQESFKDWTEYPLFMPEIDLSNEENEDIVGLKNMLSQEDTPEELVGEWKEQGNYYFKIGQKQTKLGKSAKIWNLKALKCYTMAIEEKSVSELEHKSLLSTLYANRAAVNLLLGNFGRVIEDCEKAIQFDPNNVKLYYRASKASLSLLKYENALKYCEKGLSVNPKSEELIQINKVILSNIKESQLKLNEIKQKELHNKSLQNEITSLGVTFGDYLFANIKHFVKDNKVFKDAEGVKWPTLFIYEEFKQIDFIQAFCEESTFGDHIQVMFPPGEYCPWDNNKVYSYNTIEIYAILNQVPPHDKKKKSKQVEKLELNFPHS